jgi:hypothetical protein
MEQGINEYRGKVEPLQPFMQMAEQSGAKLEDVLGRYVNMENTLRTDPVQGLHLIAQNLGATPQQLAELLTGQQAGQPDPRDQQILTLQSELSRLRQGQTDLTQTVTQQRQREVANQIDQFKAEHPRFDELAGEIAKMLETGYAADLDAAYEIADRLHPAPAPQAQPAQTRPALSVTGAPSAGSTPARGKASGSRQDAIENALTRSGL